MCERLGYTWILLYFKMLINFRVRLLAVFYVSMASHYNCDDHLTPPWLISIVSAPQFQVWQACRD